jgi:hypothetical protein
MLLGFMVIIIHPTRIVLWYFPLFCWVKNEYIYTNYGNPSIFLWHFFHISKWKDYQFLILLLSNSSA